MFVFLFCMFCFLFRVFFVFALFRVLFLPMYIGVYFLFVYNITDNCHRVATQLQLINISYHIIHTRIFVHILRHEHTHNSTNSCARTYTHMPMNGLSENNWQQNIRDGTAK
jgi:hypothetical protein